MLKFFRWVGYFECLSFLVLLLIAMPLKYFMGMPEAVKVVGMTHGMLFLMYIYTAMSVGREQNWSNGRIVSAWLIGIMPLGPVLFDKKLFAAS